jgi:hypothetical protein
MHGDGAMCDAGTAHGQHKIPALARRDAPRALHPQDRGLFPRRIRPARRRPENSSRFVSRFIAGFIASFVARLIDLDRAAHIAAGGARDLFAQSRIVGDHAQCIVADHAPGILG